MSNRMLLAGGVAIAVIVVAVVILLVAGGDDDELPGSVLDDATPTVAESICEQVADADQVDACVSECSSLTDPTEITSCASGFGSGDDGGPGVSVDGGGSGEFDAEAACQSLAGPDLLDGCLAECGNHTNEADFAFCLESISGE